MTPPSSDGRAGQRRGRAPRPRQTIKTWAFDSAGNRKYALQIQKASNGNPCLRVVEGTPQPDGSYRKFSLTFWSEDFAALFETLAAVQAYLTEHDIRTPPGHRWTPKQAGAARRSGGA